MDSFKKALPVLTALAGLSACSLSPEVDYDAVRAHEHDMKALVMTHVDQLEADCAAAMDVAREAYFVNGEHMTPHQMERDFEDKIRAEMELVDGLLEENDCWADWNIIGCDVLNGNLQFVYIPNTWIESTPQVTCSTVPFRK